MAPAAALLGRIPGKRGSSDALLEARVGSGRSLLEAAARAEICSITPNICSITPNAAEMASEGVMGIADQQAE
jgi:hypothetical protein